MNRKITHSHFFLSLITVTLICATSSLKAQTDAMSYPEQFLLHDFTNGKVLLKGGSGYDMTLNYNVVFEKIVIIQSGKICDLSNPRSVDTIYLQNRKLIPAGSAFYEVLNNTPVLFVQHLVKVSLPPRSDSYGKIPETASADAKKLLLIGGNISSDQELIFTKEEIYWIEVDKSLVSFKDSIGFFKIFPMLKNELKQYIKQNKIKFTNPDDVKKLMIYCKQISEVKHT